MVKRIVVIETPRGSAEKFAFDPEHQAFVLKKMLPVGMVFPFDFGFIPGTKADDGDPVDVVVLSRCKSFPGCRVECRIVGALLARQQKRDKKPKSMIRNDRLIAIPQAAHDMDGVKSLEDLPASMLEALEQFFVNYLAQEGTKVQVLERASASRAKKLIAKHES